MAKLPEILHRLVDLLNLHPDSADEAHRLVAQLEEPQTKRQADAKKEA